MKFTVGKKITIRRRAIFFSSTLGKIPNVAKKNNIKDETENDMDLQLHGLYFIFLFFNIISPPIYIYYTICCTC